ncbi:MAG: hemerythrin domain-containing protein [Myxococcales bacterium]
MSIDADASELTTGALIECIVGRHHAYLREALPVVHGLAMKVAGVHGAHNPRLVDLAETVRILADTLLGHLVEEESQLFPALARGAAPAAVREPLRQMEEEHRAVSGLLADIRKDSEDFLVPEWACTSYRALFGKLEELERDVMAHLHLENDVLAPRFAA